MEHGGKARLEVGSWLGGSYSDPGDLDWGDGTASGEMYSMQEVF